MEGGRLNRCPAKMAHTGQSRPDSGPEFQVQVFKLSICSFFNGRCLPRQKSRVERLSAKVNSLFIHPGGNLGANLKSISHRYYLREVVFEWEFTKETIHLPLGCLQSGSSNRGKTVDPGGYPKSLSTEWVPTQSENEGEGQNLTLSD